MRSEELRQKGTVAAAMVEGERAEVTIGQNKIELAIEIDITDGKGGWIGTDSIVRPNFQRWDSRKTDRSSAGLRLAVASRTGCLTRAVLTAPAAIGEIRRQIDARCTAH